MSETKPLSPVVISWYIFSFICAALAFYIFVFTKYTLGFSIAAWTLAIISLGSYLLGRLILV